MLVRLSKADAKLNVVSLKTDLKTNYGVNRHISTTKCHLKPANLFGRRPAKNPFISVKNRKTRFEFARKHLSWNSQQWSIVLWSDESKFIIFGSDRIKYARRPNSTRFEPKYQLPTEM